MISFLFGIPRWVWGLAAGAALIGSAVWWHGRQVRHTIAAAERRGEERAQAAYRKELARVAQHVRQLEARSSALTSQIKEARDAKDRHVAAAASTLRLSGPGKARACHPVVPQGTGGSGVADRRADAPGPALLADDRATVPWPWLVSRAEGYDLLLNYMLADQEWHRRQEDEWGRSLEK